MSSKQYPPQDVRAEKMRARMLKKSPAGQKKQHQKFLLNRREQYAESVRTGFYWDDEPEPFYINELASIFKMVRGR